MRKVIALEWMSLDGVVQAPACTDEDTSGGFKHGGWHVRYFEDRSMKWVIEHVSRAGGFLLGRRTYEVFAAHWPKASEEEQALAQPLNTRPKHVASRTLRDGLEGVAAATPGMAPTPLAVLTRRPHTDRARCGRACATIASDAVRLIRK